MEILHCHLHPTASPGPNWDATGISKQTHFDTPLIFLSFYRLLRELKLLFKGVTAASRDLLLGE